MKKIVILTIIMIVLSSSMVFANQYNSEPYYVKFTTTTGTTYYVTSNSKFELISNGEQIYGTSSFKMYNVATGNLGYTSPSSGVAAGPIPVGNISLSSHDILVQGTSTVFFKLPSAYTTGMEGAQQNLLRNLVIILPIILGGILLVIGFRKAWAMLMRTFKVI